MWHLIIFWCDDSMVSGTNIGYSSLSQDIGSMKIMLELCDPPFKKIKGVVFPTAQRFSFWFDLSRRKNRTIKRGHRG